MAPALRQVWWPNKFKPDMPPRYDGTMDPLAFLLAYEEAVLKAGGDDRVMANWLPMALTGVPHMWLLHLPAASVASWEELHNLFLTHHATSTLPVIPALLGRSQAPPSSHHVKPFVRQIGAVLKRRETPRAGWHPRPI